MSSNQRACQTKRYYVTENTMPVVCPPRDERVWDAHPRVYLNLNEQGEVACPYCGTEFILQEQKDGGK